MTATATPDFEALCKESKLLVNLTAEDEALIKSLATAVVPHLDQVTERFYDQLEKVPATAKVIEGRVDALKKTHRAWLESLFTENIDATYTEWMHHVGSVHVKVDLPVEFMTSGMALVLRELVEVLGNEGSLAPEKKLAAEKALTSLCGFSQLVMQQSYSVDRLAEALEKFLKITGMSRKLFDNLAAAF